MSLLALNLRSSCLQPPSDGITGARYIVSFEWGSAGAVKRPLDVSFGVSGFKDYWARTNAFRIRRWPCTFGYEEGKAVF